MRGYKCMQMCNTEKCGDYHVISHWPFSPLSLKLPLLTPGLKSERQEKVTSHCTMHNHDKPTNPAIDLIKFSKTFIKPIFLTLTSWISTLWLKTLSSCRASSVSGFTTRLTPMMLFIIFQCRSFRHGLRKSVITGSYTHKHKDDIKIGKHLSACKKCSDQSIWSN